MAFDLLKPVRLSRTAATQNRRNAVLKAEAMRLLAVPSKHSCLFAFLLATGARPSEALGLKWTDIEI